MGASLSDTTDIPDLIDEDLCRKLTGDLFNSTLFLQHATDGKVQLSMLQTLSNRVDVYIVYNEEEAQSKKFVVQISESIRQLGLLTRLIEGNSFEIPSRSETNRCAMLFYVTNKYMEKLASREGESEKLIDFITNIDIIKSKSAGLFNIIVAISEESMRDSSTWHGPIGFLLNELGYIDCCMDHSDENSVNAALNQIVLKAASILAPSASPSSNNLFPVQRIVSETSVGVHEDNDTPDDDIRPASATEDTTTTKVAPPSVSIADKPIEKVVTVVVSLDTALAQLDILKECSKLTSADPRIVPCITNLKQAMEDPLMKEKLMNGQIFEIFVDILKDGNFNIKAVQEICYFIQDTLYIKIPDPKFAKQINKVEIKDEVDNNTAIEASTVKSSIPNVHAWIAMGAFDVLAGNMLIKHNAHPHLLKEILATLCQISTASIGNAIFNDSQAIARIINAFAENLTDVEIVQEATCLLADLAETPGYPSLLTKECGFETLTRALVIHTSNPDIATNCCRGMDKIPQNGIAAAAAASTRAAMMHNKPRESAQHTSHTDHHGGRRPTMPVIKTVRQMIQMFRKPNKVEPTSVRHQSERRAPITQDMITTPCEVLLDVMKAHMRAEAILATALSLIVRFTTNDSENQLNVIERPGCCELLSSCLKTHKKQIDIVLLVYAVIRNISGNSNCHLDFDKSGLCESVIMTMILNTKSTRACIRGCAAIKYMVKCGKSEMGGLFAKETDYELVFVRLGVCQTISKILQMHQNISTVIIEATKLVTVLSATSHNLVVFGEGGIIEELVTSLKRHAGNAEVVESICAAIANTIEQKENRKLYSAANLRSVFEMLMSKYGQNEHINYNIVTLIHECAGNLEM